MYRCNNCGVTFFEPKIEYRKDPYGNSNVSLPDEAVCPFCGDSFEKAKKCKHCDEYFFESKHGSICRDCLDDIETRFSKLLNDNFTKLEIGALNEIYDGRNLE